MQVTFWTVDSAKLNESGEETTLKKKKKKNVNQQHPPCDLILQDLLDRLVTVMCTILIDDFAISFSRRFWLI